MSRVHELKTWPQPFAALMCGDRRHEIRVNDRDYRVGDTLLLREWIPQAHGARPQTVGMDGSPYYTGREITALVSYITYGGNWGLPGNLCVMSLGVVSINEAAP